MFRSLGTGAIGVEVENLADGLDLAARHGFAGYHFGLGEVAAMGATQALELAEEQGVKLSAWGFPLDFRGDEDAYREGMEQLPSALRTGRRTSEYRDDRASRSLLLNTEALLSRKRLKFCSSFRVVPGFTQFGFWAWACWPIRKMKALRTIILSMVGLLWSDVGG